MATRPDKAGSAELRADKAMAGVAYVPGRLLSGGRFACWGCAHVSE